MSISQDFFHSLKVRQAIQEKSKAGNANNTKKNCLRHFEIDFAFCDLKFVDLLTVFFFVSFFSCVMFPEKGERRAKKLCCFYETSRTAKSYNLISYPHTRLCVLLSALPAFLSTSIFLV